MAQVTHGLLGFGVVRPFESQVWWTNVAPGGVWHFWLDNTTLSFHASRVRIGFVDTLRQGPLHRVEIGVMNTSTHIAGFALRWSFVHA